MNYFENIQLLDAYIERLHNNEVMFLKKNSNDRNNVIENAEKLKSSSDPQEELELAKEIWRILMINALTHISVSNSQFVRGFGRLYDYYLKSIDFENLLFGMDPTYRDHTMHALWVYLLGDKILNDTSYPKNNINWGISISKAEGADEKKAQECKVRLESDLNKYIDTVYCIIALCHDLAYPYEKAEKVNRKIANMTDYLGIQSLDELKYTFSTEQSLLINKLIDLISRNLVIRNENSMEFLLDDPTFVDMSQSFEQRRHGILSSYLLYRLLDTLGEIPFTNIQDIDEKEKNARHTILRKYILYTIASHSCDYAFSTEYNRFRFMLSVVDELEEFSRYSRQGRSDVNEICKSGLEFDGNGNFIIEYLFEKEHIANPLLFFEARAIRISYMIDIDEKLEFGIKSFIMVCIDNKDPSEKRHYEFKMDKDGISCIFEVPKLNKKSERKLDPDTENNLKKFIDEWTEQN